MLNIVHDLDNWIKNVLKDFIFKNCLLGATNIVRNSDKNKHVYGGHVIAFDGAGLWSFGNHFAGKVVIFLCW